ncbi:MAG: hypothetical protein ACE147_03140 [Candidatus Methylomirabilales bacterium]
MDPALSALVEQAKRVCARHPELTEFYVRAIRDKGKGMPEDALEALLKDVTAAAGGTG